MEERLGPLKTRFCDQRSSFDGNVSLLHRGECDFLLTYAHDLVLPELDPEHFIYHRLGTERAIPVSIPDGNGEPLHAFRSGDAPVRLLSYGSSTFFARRLAQLFAERPTPLVTVYENPMSVGLKAMVLAGRGVAWVPESLVVEELRSGQLVPAADTSWYVAAEIRLYRARQQGRLPVEQFWAAVSENDRPAKPESPVRPPCRRSPDASSARPERVEDEAQQAAEGEAVHLRALDVGVDAVDDHQVERGDDEAILPADALRTVAAGRQHDAGKAGTGALGPPHIAVAAARPGIGERQHAGRDPVGRHDLLVLPAALAQEHQAEAGKVRVDIRNG